MKKSAEPTQILFEPVEPRILFSADGIGAMAVDAEPMPEEPAIEATLENNQADNTTTQENEQDQVRTEIVFIDQNVEGYEQLVDDLISNGENRNFEIRLIDSGIEEITSALQGAENISAIHIIAHGEEGEIQIGDTTVTNDSFSEFNQTVSGWSDALTEQADILFYGCNVAGSAEGQQLLGKIADATGADIAASDDLTGHIDEGGDWILEYSHGELETDIAISDQGQVEYRGVLDISTGLVGHYDFETDASDASGNNNDGTLQSGASIDSNDATDIIGEAKLFLDGNNDYVNLSSNISVFSNLSQGTIAGWINTTQNGDGSIFTLSDSSDLEYVKFGIDDGELEWVNMNSTSGDTVGVTSGANLNDGNWHHVAITVGPSGNQFYINGVSVSTNYSDGSSSDTSFLSDVQNADVVNIGRLNVQNNTYHRFDGLIDDVRVYDRVLTASDINELFNYGDNTAPILSGAHDLNAIDQNDFTNSGTLVSDLLTGNVTDPDTGALTGIAVTAVDNTNGTWEYSTNGGSSWTAFGVVDASSARLLAGDSNTFVRFVPSVDWSGTVTDGITFHAWDQTSGTAGDTVDLTSSSTIASENWSSNNYSGGAGNWDSNWSEINDNGSSSSGDVELRNTGSVVSGGGTYLQIELDDNHGIERDINLTGATSASISFYYEHRVPSGSAEVSVQAWNGSTWTNIQTLNLSGSNYMGTVGVSSGDINIPNPDTISKIRLYVSDTAGSGTVYIDNIEVVGNSVNTGGNSAFSSASASCSITVNEVNNAAVVSSVEGTALGYTENDGAVAITSSINLTDVDDVDLESAVVQITGNYVNGEDVLSFTNQNGITGNWNATTGTLTLTGTSSVSHYQAALRSITYSNSSEAPDTSTRTVSFTVNDGDVDSNTLTRDITVTSVNDEQVLATNTGATVVEGSTGNVITTAMLETTDVDNTDGELIYTITTTPGNGILYNNGVALGVSDTFSQSDIDAGLISYSHDGAESALDGFDFTVDDGQGTGTSGTFHYTVTPVNDEQVLVTNTGATVVEGSTGNVITTAMLETTDVDNTDGELIYTITTTPGNGILYNNGVALGVSDTFSQSDIDAGLISYSHDGAESALDGFDFTVDDGAGHRYFGYVSLYGNAGE